MLTGRCLVSTGQGVSRAGVGLLLRHSLGLTQNAPRIDGCDSRRALSASTGDTGQLKTQYDAVVIGAGLRSPV